MTRAWHAAAAYLAVALAATWPLARGLGRDVAWDLGDPLFVMWTLTWDCEQLLAIAGGELSRVATFFDANIFHPAPLTLAYSEHFIGQALQILPVYAATGNPILCYNLLFLSTFVLSGLGAFLLVRELTGSARAAFVAGLLFAFAPYRFPQSSHLQVLSAQWMPFALYGFRRYFASVLPGQRPRLRPLFGASAALVAQNLSCLYYLVYFSPFVAAYVCWEITRCHAWRRRRMWAALAAAAVVVTACTVPFLMPYLDVQRAFALARSRPEIVRYSADVYSYATAYAGQPLWGDVARAFPKPEGELFPGLVAVGLALIGLLFWRVPPSPQAAARPRRAPAAPSAHLPLPNVELPAANSPTPPVRGADVGRTGSRGSGRRLFVGLLAAATAAHVAAAFAGIVYRRITVDLWLFDLRITDVTQLLVRAGLSAAALLALSPAARARTSAFLREQGFFAVALVAAAWLSLGPAPQVMGRPLDLAAPYALLHDYVPGFEGLRVPARFGMLVALMMAVLGGYGAAVVDRWRGARAVLPILGLVFLAESLPIPFTVNGGSTPPGFATPEPRVYRPGRAPAAYHALARQPAGSVIAELPLGYPEFDLRAMFYSVVHGHAIVNGYSGFFPPHYPELALGVSDVPRHPQAAADALRAVGATHVLVHESAYLNGQGEQTTVALQALGAAEVFRDGGDVVLELDGGQAPAARRQAGPGWRDTVASGR